MIVPDTNVVSEAMQPQPDGTVIAWLNAQAVESLEIWRAKSPTLFDKRPTGLPGLDRVFHRPVLGHTVGERPSVQRA